MSSCHTGWILMVAAAAAVRAVSAACDDKSCHGVDYYCDKFQGECRPCRELCTQDKGGKFAECEAMCEDFLKNAIFNNSLSTTAITDEDVWLIEVLLITITAVVSLVLVIVLVLLALKVQNRKKMTLRNNDVIPMLDLQHRASTPQSTASTTAVTAVRSHTTATQNGLMARSLQTVTTQLSEEDSSVLSSRHRHSNRHLKQGSFQGNRGNHHHHNGNCRSPSRIPSEDRVTDPHAYTNPALETSSTTPSGASGPPAAVTPSTTNFPPIGTGVNRAQQRPYTISHSQVL